MRKRLYLCFGVIMVLALASPAQADYRLAPVAGEKVKGIELTPWLTLKPFFRQTLYYTTNLLQERNHEVRVLHPSGIVLRLGGKEDDVVSATIGGVDWEVKGRRGEVSVGYDGTLLVYADHSDLNTVEHRARFKTKLELDKLTFNAQAAVAWAISNTDPQFSGRIRNNRSDGTADLTYQISDSFALVSEGFWGSFDNFPREVEPSNVAEWGVNFLFKYTLASKAPAVSIIAGPGFREFHYFNHQATLPDLSFANVIVGAEVSFKKIVEARFRIGPEAAWIKKRRGFSRRRSVPDGIIASGDLTWKIQKSTEASIFASLRTTASAQALLARTGVYGLRVQQDFPNDFRAVFTAALLEQFHRHQPTQHTQSYALDVQYERTEGVVIGAGMTYDRSYSRRPGFEVFTIGISLTLRH